MDHAKATRLFLSVFVSLTLYVVGMLMILRIFFRIENGSPMNEWTRVDPQVFWAVVASYPVATVVASILLAREFRAPVLATVLATALGIAIVWLMFWMRPNWFFYSVLAFLPVATLAISVVLARRFEAPLFATATVALTALGLLMGLLIF